MALKINSLEIFSCLCPVSQQLTLYYVLTLTVILNSSAMSINQCVQSKQTVNLTETGPVLNGLLSGPENKLRIKRNV
jgi:hypothetical protein